jgi:hypothetical protein
VACPAWLVRVENDLGTSTWIVLNIASQNHAPGLKMQLKYATPTAEADKSCKDLRVLPSTLIDW